MVWTLLFLVSAGILAGTLGSLAGLGGGVVIVPSILFLGAISEHYQVSPQVAVGTSLMVIIFISISSTLSYAKQKKWISKAVLLFF